MMLLRIEYDKASIAHAWLPWVDNAERLKQITPVQVALCMNLLQCKDGFCYVETRLRL